MFCQEHLHLSASLVLHRGPSPVEVEHGHLLAVVLATRQGVGIDSGVLFGVVKLHH
jgi:hypothetical protein